MIHAVVTATVSLAVGCGDAREPSSDTTVVTVSATAGLPEFRLSPSLAGSSAAAVGLVFEDIEMHAKPDSRSKTGTRLVLKRRATSTVSAAELAETFSYDFVRSVRALDDDTIEIDFSEVLSMDQTVERSGFDRGPFFVEHRGPQRVRLRRRGSSSIDVVEVVATSASDQWRLLLAGDVNVVPRAPSLVRQSLEGITGLRILDVAHVDSAALYFNVRAVEPTMRREIAKAIDLDALAVAVCGDSTCALPEIATVAAASDAPQGGSPPRRIVSLQFVPTESTHAVAARVLRHQLAGQGIEIGVQPTTVEQLVSRVQSGQFEAAIIPLPTSDRRYRFFVSQRSPTEASVTGYSNAEYDAAFARSDTEAMQTLLDRDVPVVPLFLQSYVAVIDSRLCGDVTPSATSWRWIADLRPCRPGETP